MDIKNKLFQEWKEGVGCWSDEDVWDAAWEAAKRHFFVRPKEGLLNRDQVRDLTRLAAGPVRAGRLCTKQSLVSRDLIQFHSQEHRRKVFYEITTKGLKLLKALDK